MADYTLTSVGRASAVLTTGEVAGAALPLERVKDKRVTVSFNFTQGSLTNGIIRFYVSRDNSTYFPLYLGGTAMTETLTADGTRCYALPPMNGWKWFRATLQGTGTVTSSAGAFSYFWEKLGSP
jgi:hypothetical protein